MSQTNLAGDGWTDKLGHGNKRERERWGEEQICGVKGVEEVIKREGEVRKIKKKRKVMPLARENPAERACVIAGMKEFDTS